MDTLLFVLFFLQQIYFSASSSPWSLDGSQFPNPIIDQVECNRHPNKSSAVCDPDSILGIDDSDRVEAIINEILDIKDKCGHGYEVGVAVVKKLNLGISYPDEATRRFAQSVHNSWGVGDPECETGILFALSTDDHTFYFSLGDGVMNILTDKRLDSMTDMTDLFREGEFGGGTVQAMLDVKSFLLKGPSTESFAKKYWWSFLLIVPAGLCIICYPLCRCHSKRKKRRKMEFEAHKQRILDEYRNKEIADQYCPICLKLFSTDLELGPPSPNDCGHYYHEACLEGVKECPFCVKKKQARSKDEDHETKVKFEYLSKKYRSEFPSNAVWYYSATKFLDTSRSTPIGYPPAPPKPTHSNYSHYSSGHNSSSYSGGFSSGGYSGGFSSSVGHSGGHFSGGHSGGGHGGHF